LNYARLRAERFGGKPGRGSRNGPKHTFRAFIVNARAQTVAQTISFLRSADLQSLAYDHEQIDRAHLGVCVRRQKESPRICRPGDFKRKANWKSALRPDALLRQPNSDARQNKTGQLRRGGRARKLQARHDVGLTQDSPAV